MIKIYKNKDNDRQRPYPILSKIYSSYTRPNKIASSNAKPSKITSYHQFIYHAKENHHPSAKQAKQNYAVASKITSNKITLKIIKTKTNYKV